jgi:hypothetical protein
MYFGQLSLDVAWGQTAYSIHQFPPGNCFPDQLDTFAVRRRSIPGFRVLEVKDPGTNVVLIYYVTDRRFLMVEKAGFEDTNLDTLIQSMR